MQVNGVLFLEDSHLFYLDSRVFLGYSWSIIIIFHSYNSDFVNLSKETNCILDKDNTSCQNRKIMPRVTGWPSNASISYIVKTSGPSYGRYLIPPGLMILVRLSIL
jgi:hypothetical protein